MREARLCAVAVAALVSSASQPALAAPREVAPLSPETCRAVADAFSKRLKGMTVSVVPAGAPSEVIDRLRVTGAGCVFTGTKPAKSMPRDFFFDTLDVPFFTGWEQALPAAADGPNGGTFGWFQGPAVVVYDMHILVPEAVCKSARDVEACEAKNWSQAIYTLKGNAFRFVDGGAVTDADFAE